MDDNLKTSIEETTSDIEIFSTRNFQLVIDSDENESSSSCRDSDNSQSLSSAGNRNYKIISPPVTSAVLVEREINGVALQDDYPSVLCEEINISSSNNVHIGSKHVYNGPVTINQYIHGNLDPLAERDPPGNKSNEHSEHEGTSCSEDERAHRFLYRLKFYLTDEKWHRTRLYTIVICTIISIIIPTAVISTLTTSVNAPPPLDVPLPPTNPVNITQLTQNSVVIHWEMPEYDGGSTVKAYKIEKKDVNESEWIEVGRTPTQEIVVENLQTHHEYVFSISAENIIGLSKPLFTQSPFEIKPMVPSPPTSLEIHQISDDTVVIEWKVPRHNGGVELEAYKIDQKNIINSNWSEVGCVNASILNLIVKELEMYNAYYFKIYAKNKVGLGKPIESQEPIQIQPIDDPFEIVSRQRWGALKPRIPPIQLEVRPPRYVIICHTYYWYCKTIDSCTTVLKKLQKSAIKSGYGDIEYNFVIPFDGNVYQGRGWNTEGNHTLDFNNKSLAIGFVGNYDIFKPTKEQLDSLKKLLRLGVKEFRMTKEYVLLGQKQVMKNTTSPGKYLYDRIRTWKHWASEP